MERLKIILPETFSFSTTLAVRITDLNYGGHLGNDSFLSLVHEARVQFLRHHGYSELAFEGCGLIMAYAEIEFRRELNYGDVVRISVAADHFDKLGFDLFYRLEVQVGEELVLAGKVKTGMMCFDYAAKKKASLPAAAIARLSAGKK